MPEPSKHHQQIGRIGGLTSYAVRTPEQEANRKKRAAEGRMRRFLEAVPPHVTDPIERAQKAAALQTAWMQDIARKSGAKRSKRPVA
ncbi:hypothetical protein [Actinoplanes regularis]|uniref:hypothetical protein n=1 Tax=Actinoplanes regularis TaxID=52697 RepID=UPI0024A14B9B|nr:hypothetical protein [Actinoplanes regularis]GLW32240.1 hypothetical protein Areg01_51790 [Actinoplanes regularis]